MLAIEVSHLRREFSFDLRREGAGLWRLFSYFWPKKGVFVAVDDLSFSIAKGEKVAFIGPNGAGKSTAIRMMTGISAPTRGYVSLLGKEPIKHRRELASQMGVLFGQGSKLWPSLCVEESFRLLAAIYGIEKGIFTERLNKLVDQFGIASLLKKGAKALSLGERMRCEIVATFLHAPRVVFLDEPTIGLDLLAKTAIRELLCSVVKEEGVTLVLTSHDTDDIERVCDRVIMLDKGKMVLDAPLNEMKRYIRKKWIEVFTEEPHVSWRFAGTHVVSQEMHRLKIEVDLERVGIDKALTHLFSLTSIRDLKIEDPSLETVIKRLYGSFEKL